MYIFTSSHAAPYFRMGRKRREIEIGGGGRDVSCWEIGEEARDIDELQD